MKPGPLIQAKYAKTRAARTAPVVTLLEARDAIEGCYCMTHFRYVAEHAARLGTETTEEAIAAVITRLYRQGFARLGFDYAHPTKPQLRQVLDFLDRDLRWAAINAELCALHVQICQEILLHVPADPLSE